VAVEEKTGELENAMSEQRRKAEQETAALKKEFKEEQDDLVGKLDKMRDKYFENHPDLDRGRRPVTGKPGRGQQAKSRGSSRPTEALGRNAIDSRSPARNPRVWKDLGRGTFDS
jgi:hypothetical protein